MVDAARDFREQIGGIRISKGCRLIDSLACGLAECGERSRDSKHVLLCVRDAKWIGDEKRVLGRYLDRAICRALPPSPPARSAIRSE
jgi:hypothetical protein